MKLYKYRSISGAAFRYTQDIFINRRLFAPQASILNDPNEGIATIDVQNGFRITANTAFEHGRQNNIGLCAFSETHRNPVMWAHYSDQHHGICIEFESNYFDLSDGLLKKVNYSNQVSTFPHNSSFDEREAFLNKTIEWAYEKEWRYITNSSNSFLGVTELSIERVLLGARFDKSDLSWVKFWLEHYSPKKNIPIVKMQLVLNEYELYEESETKGKYLRTSQW
jgi:hypothetical protein